jgi:uncharacterized protein DUF3667
MNTAAPPAATVAVRCENCGNEVSQRYCGACGQRLEPPVHTLWHFMKVATEDLTHTDSRLWRTLWALLFKPGFLTRQFLDGRRARYLPPVRLYLVLSVVFFVYASAFATHRQLQLLQFDDKAPGAAQTAATSQQPRSKGGCHDIDYQGPWQQRVGPALRNACARIEADNGRSLRESFFHNLPRAMFLFLPLLAGAMMLIYWRPRHYYVEHLLLFVHNHAFIFLVIGLTWALEALLPFAAGLLRTVLPLYIAWYIYRSMRVVYGQGRWLTLGKLVLLSFFYLVSGALMLGLTTAYSALTL